MKRVSNKPQQEKNLFSVLPKQESMQHMPGSRKFCQRGSNFDNVFFLFVFQVDDGEEDPNTTINRPSLARQCYAGVPMMTQR